MAFDKSSYDYQWQKENEKKVQVPLSIKKDDDIIDFLEIQKANGQKASPLIKKIIRMYMKTNGYQVN